ncbi:MAG: ankyrin repeat domain-containing protein [Candidatus Sulfotelmatobacter sp.]
MSDTPNRLVYSAGKLPARANLEHLKNEAKQLLKTMRSRDPHVPSQTRADVRTEVRLAEAQLLVARSYGFASWRRLKSFVDALHDFGRQLINAVHAGDLETMRKILDRHPDLVNAGADLPRLDRPSDTVAMRLIHLAIAEAKVDVLRLLIERGADLNARNADGRLPLHDCFELNHDDFAKILLEAGAEPDVCAAAAYGMHDQLEQILNRDPATVNDLITGNSPLGWAAFGHQPKSATILFQHGAIAGRAPYDAYAWGPAAGVNSIDVARVLLEHGANPNWRDDDGNTPLHRVINARIVLDPAKFIHLLLEFGSDPGLRNREGRTPLDEAEALLHAGKLAETYFPARPIGPKRLEQTIQLLRSQRAHPS